MANTKQKKDDTKKPAKKKVNPLYEGLEPHEIPKTKGGKALLKLRRLMTEHYKREPIPLPD